MTTSCPAKGTPTVAPTSLRRTVVCKYCDHTRAEHVGAPLTREDRPVAQTELNPASYDPVEYTHEDIAEVPSAKWGWSGESPKAMRVAALVVAAMLLFMMHGNHHGFVEDLWLIGFAIALVGLVVRDVIVKRKPR
ncbi:hypothetical protein RhoFasB10_03219 [Rhodococcus sp. B10]|nr:hypothetical protein [Rhodococcus sp. B10]